MKLVDFIKTGSVLSLNIGVKGQNIDDMNRV
jgi:hypothetical protein